MTSEQRDLLLRTFQADTAWRRQGNDTMSFQLLHLGGMERTIDHPTWDTAWSVPTHHTIDDLDDLGFLRVEPTTGNGRSFVLTPAGRQEAEAIEAARNPPTAPSDGGRAPATDEVLAWLVDVREVAPECFDLPRRLIDRAVSEDFISAAARASFAERVLDLVEDGYLRGDVLGWDQAGPEELLTHTQNLRLTMNAHQAVPRRPATAESADVVTRAENDEVRDVFISHAGADKEEVARPLAEALRARGFTVWFDEYELVVGDRLSETIDRGLASSRTGVVVLSPAFFSRQWPRRELAGFVAREMATGEQIVLPVWHGVEHADIANFSLPLADLMAVSTEDGVEAVADALAPAIKRRRGQEALSGRQISAANIASTAVHDQHPAVDDEALFEFDLSRLADFNVARAHRMLTEHGDLYRAQLIMALWLDGWRDRMAQQDWSDDPPEEAFDYAVRELAAHLRQGDFLPTGIFYRETVDPSPSD